MHTRVCPRHLVTDRFFGKPRAREPSHRDYSAAPFGESSPSPTGNGFAENRCGPRFFLSDFVPNVNARDGRRKKNIRTLRANGAQRPRPDRVKKVLRFRERFNRFDFFRERRLRDPGRGGNA